MNKTASTLSCRTTPGRGIGLAVCRAVVACLLPAALIGLALLLTARPAAGAEWSLHGFGTVGLAWFDKPHDWGFMRSVNQHKSREELRADVDSVAGLQANFAVSRQIEVVGQISATALEDAKANDYVGLAFLAWRPDPHWTLRAGRVNLDAFLYSDHRDVGYTYTFIRPPVEYYGRMPAWLDGGDVTRSWVGSEAQWQAKLFAGRTSAGTDGGRLELSPLFGVMLSREAGGLLLRISAVHAKAADTIAGLRPLIAGLTELEELSEPTVAAGAAELKDSLITRGTRTRYIAAGVSYDRHGWLAGAEVSRARVDARNASFTSGYVSIGRRFGTLTGFVIESAAMRDARPRAVPDWSTPLAFDPILAAQAQAIAVGATQAFNNGAAHQYTTSVGLRWDVVPNVAVKTQWDHVRTRREGSGLWHGGDGVPHHSDVVAVAIDFVF